MNLKKILLTLSLAALTALWLPALSATPDTKKSILILATNHVTEGKLQLFSRLAIEQNLFKVDYRYLRKLKEGESLSALVSPYGLVIFDSVSGREAEKDYSHFEALVAADEERRFLPIKLTKATKLRKGFTDSQAQILYDYYYNGGEENLRRLLVFIGSDLFAINHEQAQPPITFPKLGIYHPDYEKTVFDNLADYKTWASVKDGAPLIGIAISRETIAAAETQITDALIKNIEAKGGVAVPFYYPGYGENEYIDLLSIDGEVALDNIINTRIIHWAEKRRGEYETLGVPVLQVLPYTRGDQGDWEADQAGIPAQVTPFYLTMPEIAGVIDPVVISARVSADDHTKDKSQNKSQTPIDYQLDSVVNKALKFAALKHKVNADKKVAIMFYNYPAGEKNASASFLNVPTSLAAIFNTLKTADYRVEAKEEQWFIEQTGLMLRPFHRELPYTELPGLGSEEGAGGLLPMTHYLAWYNTLPLSVRSEIEAQWGPPENSFTVAEIDGQPQFIIPRSLSGNVMVLPQPPRGNRQERESAIYHDKIIPISHNYLAVYLYVREQFGADAIVHLGTHGSHEWLPGKERGLSVYDAGNLAAGDTPIIYPFIMDDVGEALQTKRRGRATVISHLTPPFAKSGLYEELVDLHGLMHQYKELDEGGVKARTQQAIIDATVERDIHQDLAWSESEISARFEAFMPVLHDYLAELGAQNQPLGLHTFGVVPKEEHLVSTLVQMLGKRFVEPAEHYASASDAHEHAHKSDHGSVADYRTLNQTPEFQLIRRFIMGDSDIATVKEDELRALLEEAKAHYANFKGIEENSALLEALSGKYVSSSSGGDPIRSPEALPSGRNLYGFDPAKIPTKAAWDAGVALMTDLIDNYHQDHAAYPDKLTFSMWSIETMRHLGVVESQVLYAMGVKPVWNEGGRIIDTEIISYSELKRPRVDVVLSATGLYRDAFPNIMMMIAGAVEKVAKLKEENNFVYRHAEKIKKELIAEGMDEAEANKLSTIRIFSNESGNYGTNVASASMASDTWQSEDKLAKLYLSRMGFFYGSDENTWGEKLPDIDLYAKNLSGTDAAVFSRSSNVYGLLTSDDPFQYMGGISLAVRHLDGKSPQMYISNLRDPDNSRNEPLGRFLATELRTRQFHPQWIKEIQAEGYAGTLTTLDVMNNFWGWQVVDPDNVRDDQWQEFFEVYVQDKYEMDMREWYEENNAHALAQMIERMLEATRKEYWNASEETIKELVETYIELAKKHDVFSKNEIFDAHVNKQALGFGLAPLTQATAQDVQPPESAQPKPMTKNTQVEGQVMEKVQESEATDSDNTHYLLALLGLFFVVGFLYQFSPWPKPSKENNNV